MSTQNPKKVKKKKSHPYFELIPPLLICIAVVVYIVINLAQSDVLGVPLHSILHQSNHTTFTSSQHLQTALQNYDKDILVEAMFSVYSNDEINKLINYIHRISPPKPDITIHNISPSPTTITPKTENISMWQNISYHNKYLPEYHLRPLSSEIFNANPMKNTVKGAQVREITGSNSHTAKDKEYDKYISLFIQQSSTYKNISWYKDLAKYKLQLKCITLQNNQAFVSHPINKNFMIYPHLQIVEYFLCKTAQGYGNGFSRYWGVRSLAYWMNYHFKINCKGYQQDIKQTKNKLMSAFLPSNIASNANRNIHMTGNISQHNVVTFMPMIAPPKQYSVIHPTSLIFMYYNPYFQSIMNYETMKACIDYYNFIGGEKRMDLIDTMSETNDIVIHIRCGDVMSIMHRVNDWDYGFLTLAHYRYVMEIALQKRFGIDWYARITNKTTVWILSQLSNKSARKGEMRSVQDCDFLINYMVENGLREIFKPAVIKIMYDSDVNDDFYRMLTAPLLFCSPSTFCLNAGIANMNGFVVIPNRGAWIDFFNIDAKNKTEDFIVASHSHLIPENQLIIDTEKNGWHCNKIDNYNFNKQTYKQSVYAHKLAEYLVAH